jgi:hypothetical protein
MAGNTADCCAGACAALHGIVAHSALRADALPRDSHRASFSEQVLATPEEDVGYLATALVWELGRYSNAYNIFVRGNLLKGWRMRMSQHLTGSREFPHFFNKNGAVILQRDLSLRHLSSTLTLLRKVVTMHAVCYQLTVHYFAHRLYLRVSYYSQDKEPKQP